MDVILNVRTIHDILHVATEIQYSTVHCFSMYMKLAKAAFYRNPPNSRSNG